MLKKIPWNELENWIYNGEDLSNLDPNDVQDKLDRKMNQANLEVSRLCWVLAPANCYPVIISYAPKEKFPWEVATMFNSLNIYC